MRSPATPAPAAAKAAWASCVPDAGKFPAARPGDARVQADVRQTPCPPAKSVSIWVTV